MRTYRRVIVMQALVEALMRGFWGWGIGTEFSHGSGADSLKGCVLGGFLERFQLLGLLLRDDSL